MKHNKIFAFLLAGVLSLGIVGCGSAGSSDSSSTEQAASSASGDLKPLRLGLTTTRAIWKKNSMPQATRWIW